MRLTPASPPADDDVVAGAIAAVRGLHDAGLDTAPHVAAALVRVYGAGDAVAQAAQALTDAQRRGTAALPDPLPLVPALAARLAATVSRLPAADRQLLLQASVLTDDRLDVLLAVSGRSIEELIGSPLAQQLLPMAGHVRFADPGLRVYIHESASLAARTAAHASLAAAYAAREEPDRAAWHRALSALQGDGELASPLRALAVAADADGDAAWAFAVAREAAAHASGTLRAAIAADAGCAALHAGCIDDALRWLGEARAAGGAAAARAYPAWVHAVALATGEIPVIDEEPGAADAHAVAAGLAAARGDATAVHDHLRHATGSAGWTDAAQWCRSLGFAVSCEEPAARALALDGPAAQLLDLCGGTAHARMCVAAECACPQPAAAARSPLAAAYRSVLGVLSIAWAGDLTRAADACVRAIVSGPFQLPLDGLGTALGRRLGVLTGGELAVVAPALEAAAPYPVSARVRWEAVVDAELAAAQCGQGDRARALAALAADRAADIGSGAPLHLPGGDALLRDEAPVRMPESARLAARVRGNLRDAVDLRSQWRAAEMARGIRSPFERARVELELARAHARIGQREAAERALIAAEQLFAAAGSPVWAGALDAVQAEIVTMDVADADAADAFHDCRRAWAPVLTDRELEVALLVAEGLSNGEVAQRLFVSPRTVEVHLRKVFGKLDVRSRTELSVLAHRVERALPRITA